VSNGGKNTGFWGQSNLLFGPIKTPDSIPGAPIMEPNKATISVAPSGLTQSWRNFKQNPFIKDLANVAALLTPIPILQGAKALNIGKNAAKVISVAKPADKIVNVTKKVGKLGNEATSP